MAIQRTLSRPRSTESICIALIEAVAEDRGVDLIDMPPLAEQIDTDALDTLFAPTGAGISRTGEVEFQYDDYVVTVAYEDEITIFLERRDS